MGSPGAVDACRTYSTQAAKARLGTLRGFEACRAAIATTARSASFTDFESGKTAANSGSRSTTLVPRRYRSTYLPRTPPEKSYSALISLVRRAARSDRGRREAGAIPLLEAL